VYPTKWQIRKRILERQCRYSYGPCGVYNGGISISGNVTAVTFSAGNYGNTVNFNGNGGNLVFNPGQYQNGGNGDSITLSGNTTTTFNAGAYTFFAAPSTSLATAL
jgi:hypothetical protein